MNVFNNKVDAKRWSRKRKIAEEPLELKSYNSYSSIESIKMEVEDKEDAFTTLGYEIDGREIRLDLTDYELVKLFEDLKDAVKLAKIRIKKRKKINETP